MPMLPMPTQCPVTGGPLLVTKLECEESGVTIRGRFAIPSYAKLDAEQAHFLETFLRCRGMLNAVERELGISYPTVRARLDSLLQALNLAPFKEDSGRRRASEQKQAILEQLERGEISAEEAKSRLKEVSK